MCRMFVLLLTCILLLPDSVHSYTGIDGGMFDRSPNGYGWHLSYNRKIQACYTGYFEECIGTFQRRLDNEFGTGVIGGMMGEWQYSEYPSSYADTVYTRSPYQSEGNLAGGRYPYTCEFR